MTSKIGYLFKLFPKINWLKTLRFNLHYFNLSVALRLPALVYWRTKFNSMEGTVKLCGKVRTGMLRIGVPYIGVQDHRYSRTIWQLRGGVIINELANFGRGSRVCVEPQAELSLGKCFNVTGDATFICRNKIQFGDDCLVSWDVQIMDTDLHKIVNLDNKEKEINPDRPIMIGNRVWIGCRSTILKGSMIPDSSILAAGSLVTSHLEQVNTVYGGQGKEIKPLKNNVGWVL